MILSWWDWNQVTREAPWKNVLAFLAWPVLAAQPYAYRTESDLHREIAGVWRTANVPVRHEVSLGPGLRIDFVSRGIGVEIKTAGSPVDISKQLRRYGTTYKLSALLLLTTCPSHLQIPEHGYGVPTAAIGLSAVRLSR
jgi:hypothetical protein